MRKLWILALLLTVSACGEKLIPPVDIGGDDDAATATPSASETPVVDTFTPPAESPSPEPTTAPSPATIPEPSPTPTATPEPTPIPVPFTVLEEELRHYSNSGGNYNLFAEIRFDFNPPKADVCAALMEKPDCRGKEIDYKCVDNTKWDEGVSGVQVVFAVNQTYCGYDPVQGEPIINPACWCAVWFYSEY